ncbi:Uncharacterised protein [Vibrio cholerae]|nr:Uncharacterised protein [Vibrio cholerae]
MTSTRQRSRRATLCRKCCRTYPDSNFGISKTPNSEYLKA